jgi:hypothetical protein
MRLARQLHVREADMFRTEEDVLIDAYRLQADRIAYAPGESQNLENPTIESATG